MTEFYDVFPLPAAASPADAIPEHQALRDAFTSVRKAIACLPDGREKGAALLRLDESAHWAHIALHARHVVPLDGGHTH